MQKLYWFILGATLLQGFFVHAKEPKPPASEKLAAFFYQRALELGQGNAQEALRYADSLEFVARNLNDQRFLYNAFKIKGDLYRHIGNYKQAFFWLHQAFNTAKNNSDTLNMVRACNNLGAVFQNTGAMDKALENYLQAYFLGASFLDPGQKATVLMNIGLVYEELSQYNEALSYYSKALRLIEKEKLPGSLALVHSNLGSLYSNIKNKDKALVHLKIARKLFEEQGNEIRLAEVLNEFSLVHLQDEPEIALEYLYLAESLYQKYQSRAGLYETHKNTGKAYVNQGKSDRALRHFNLAQQYSDTLQNNFLKGDIFLSIACLYEDQQDFKNASDFYKQYSKLNQNMKREELLHNITKTSSEYELNQRDQQIVMLEQQAEGAVSRLWFHNAVVGFLLVLVSIGLAIFFFFKNKKARRLNTLLRNKNQLMLVQKQAIEEQYQKINSRYTDLENARNISEENFKELIREKDQLEEKVRVRTKELEEMHQRLALHLNNSSMAVLEWNAGMELVHWPKQAEVVFGFTAKEVLGLHINEVPFIKAEDRKELIGMIEQLFKGELTRQHFTRKGNNRFGGSCFIEWNFSLLFNAEGQPKSILSVASDVSFREQTYRELKDANQELDTFLYKSSHDLRGPIARMQGIINLGLLESKDKQAQLYFNMLNKVTDELNNLLLRLLMVHNINQHSFKLEDIPFASFVDKVVSNHIHKKASFQELKINNKVPADLVVKSDQTLLTIIIINLLENGMMFADNFNPLIEIEAVYLPSGKYIISVTDNGVGVPEEYREKVFDMFFQGSTRSTSTGLGLYMVRKAAKRLGGEVQLISGSGQTIFEIMLPAERSTDMVNVRVIE